MANMPKALPTAALAEILAQDGELDRILDGRGLTFQSTPAPPGAAAAVVLHPAP